MDYRIDDSAREMAGALVEFLRGRLPDPATEPDAAARAGAWRELVGSEWLEHYATTAGVKEPDPAELVLALHVAEAFGTVAVSGPVSVVAGYLHPLARLAGLDALARELRSGQLVTSVVATVAPADPDVGDGAPRWRLDRLPVIRDVDQLTVSGVLPAVAALADAVAVVVPVELDGRPALALVRTDTPGVQVGPSSGVDVRCPVAELRLSGVRLAPEAVHSPADGADLRELEHRAGLLASLFLDAEAVGGASEVLSRSVEYCTGRIQFGRPIGSFQAVRHRLADAAVRTEGARSLVHRTGWDVAAAGASQPPAALDVLASRLWCSATYLGACEAAIQCHGGMGFTWEQGLHVWHRAAIAGRGLHAGLAPARAGIATHLRSVATAATTTAGATDPGTTSDAQATHDPVATGDPAITTADAAAAVANGATR